MDKQWIVVWVERDKLVGAVQYGGAQEDLERQIRQDLEDGLWLRMTEVRTVMEFHQVVQGAVKRMVVMLPPDTLGSPAPSILVKPTAVRVPVGRDYKDLVEAIEQSEKTELVNRAKAAGIQLTLPGTGFGSH